MKKLLSVICVLLCGCTGTSEHPYKYEMKNTLNTELKKSGTCIAIDNDKTVYEWDN